MLESLSSYADRLTSMQHIITELMDARGINAWARLYYEFEGTPVYLVMKHRDSTKLDELNAVGDEIERVFSTEWFYIHRNSNNIAWLPCPVEKGLSQNKPGKIWTCE